MEYDDFMGIVNDQISDSKNITDELGRQGIAGDTFMKFIYD